MAKSKQCQAVALVAVFCTIAPVVSLAQSAMKPLNKAEMRELRIYEAKELTRRALELGQAGKNAEAVPLAEQALERREKALPPDHADLSASVVMLGVLYQRVGRYGEAETLLKRGLEIREHAQPADLYSVVSSLTILGSFYDALSRFSEAEPLFKRVLEVREKLLEANSLSNGVRS
jgi:tetratricopeptide (TPR) repeat protein